MLSAVGGNGKTQALLAIKNESGKLKWAYGVNTAVANQAPVYLWAVGEQVRKGSWTYAGGGYEILKTGSNPGRKIVTLGVGDNSGVHVAEENASPALAGQAKFVVGTGSLQGQIDDVRLGVGALDASFFSGWMYANPYEKAVIRFEN